MLVYNTQQDNIAFSEYGRVFQSMVDKVVLVKDKVERTKYAHSLISVMEQLNPSVKELDNYKQKLWDHLFYIAGFRLDVDAPYPMPLPSNLNLKPKKVPYHIERIKFRFYGRNLQYMIDKAKSMKDLEMQKKFTNVIASFMTNSSKNWNNENLLPEVIIDHIKNLSKNELNPTPEDLNLHIEKGNNFRWKQNSSPINQNNKKFNNNKRFKPNQKNRRF